jgi:predicted DNA-binding transcriptional regulator YafY
MNREEVVEEIRRAGRQHRILRIQAREANGTIEPREVEPYSFRPLGTTERLFVHCLLRGATRSFLVDNVLEARCTDRQFEPRWPVEL